MSQSLADAPGAPAPGFKTDVLPFISATFGEFAALYFWLMLMDQGQFILATVVLWAGFLLERISVIAWIRYVYRPRQGVAAKAFSPLKALVRLILVTLSEILIWVLWLWLADHVHFWLGAAVLMVLMLLEHSMEMSLLKKDHFLKYTTNARTILFTVIEVAGGVGWLYLVRQDEPLWGAVVLLLGLSIEHVLQGSQLKPAPADRLPA